jgi:hypothetical protein
MLAQYTKATGQHDPKGEYLCESCMMYIPGKKGMGSCTAVGPEGVEKDGAHISGKKGGCNLYVNGPAASKEKTNPNRLSKAASGYMDAGPFGCSRCGNFEGPGSKHCLRVLGDEKKGVGTIEAGECCNGWQSVEEARSTMAYDHPFEGVSAKKAGKMHGEKGRWSQKQKKVLRARAHGWKPESKGMTSTLQKRQERKAS